MDVGWMDDEWMDKKVDRWKKPWAIACAKLCSFSSLVPTRGA